MQKFIRFALPCVCFAVIIWCCLFGGFNHIDWKLLLGAAVVGGVCWVVLYVKQHNILGKIEEHRNQLKMVAEEAPVFVIGTPKFQDWVAISIKS